MLSELAKNIKQSSTLAITAKAKQLKKAGHDIIGFGAGEPDFDTPEFIKDAAVAALEKGMTKYTAASGSPELKNAIKYKFSKENGLKYDVSEIIACCGAKHALFNLIMCMAGKGDQVLIPSPYWLSYPEMVKAAGAEPVFIDCSSTDFKLTAELLSKNITERTQILILNSPSNPTGAVYSAKELKTLSDAILNSKVMVISDEIYEHLAYDINTISMAQISPEMKARTIVVNGVSKAYAMTGWRIGYAAGNSEIIYACSRLQSHSTSNPTSFAQAGAIAALTSAESPTAVESMKAEFSKRRDYIYERLSSMRGIRVNKPAGAFYIFPDISACLKDKASSFDFAARLLEEKYVAVVPGEDFGAPGYIRLSYAVSMEDIKKGLARLEEFIR